MHTLLTMLAPLVRLLRPARGLHAAPRALRHDIREEARANRVRRYANPLPARAVGPGQPKPFATVTPISAPREVEPTVAMIRGYFLAHERERGRVYSNRERLGMIVAMDVAKMAS